MLNVVYPLTSQLDYTELKYSLRSIEKFLSAPFEVVIVGNRLPDWINNVTQINLPDVPGRKQLSIRMKILAALEYAEEILFMNDDVFLLRPHETFPYYFNGYLKNYQEAGAKPLEKELIAAGFGTRLFDGHYPLIYGEGFKYASRCFSEDVILKSMYCNYMGIEGTFIPDCKLLKPMSPEQIKEFIKDKPCFSTGTYSLQSALPILKELFPDKSNFEI